MTKSQSALYWREWQSVRKHCAAANLPVPDRHALHREALGRDASSKTLDNRALDKVLGVFRAHSAPASVNAQLRQIRQPRTRILHKIFHEQVPMLDALGLAGEEYLMSILQVRFNTDDLTTLDDTRLEQCLMTLAARIDAKRRERDWSKHDLWIAAHIPCPCAACRQASVSASEPALATATPF